MLKALSPDFAGFRLFHKVYISFPYLPLVHCLSDTLSRNVSMKLNYDGFKIGERRIEKIKPEIAQEKAKFFIEDDKSSARGLGHTLSMELPRSCGWV